jgi:hypothetical protein
MLSVVAPNMAHGMTINVVTIINYSARGVIFTVVSLQHYKT